GAPGRARSAGAAGAVGDARGPGLVLGCQRVAELRRRPLRLARGPTPPRQAGRDAAPSLPLPDPVRRLSSGWRAGLLPRYVSETPQLSENRGFSAQGRIAQ